MRDRDRCTFLLSGSDYGTFVFVNMFLVCVNGESGENVCDIRLYIIYICLEIYGKMLFIFLLPPEWLKL